MWQFAALLAHLCLRAATAGIAELKQKEVRNDS